MPNRLQQLRDALSDACVIDREIGAGGMATVYLAHDVRHDRDVALKVLHPDLASALGPERFQREIKLAARLQHPHILTVLDSGETSDGQLWFTMPYVDGESLRDRLTRETQLPVADALRIARETAQALQYAHQHGVIHRDIKPENLLLTEDGNTLVADFGIARSLGSSSGSRLTETGIALGTPAYMSPEQASGERELSARTDVYSLAAVLYEMLAGEPPFTGPTAQAIIAKRFAGVVPSVRQVRPSVPESVDQAVTQALAVVPADRFASAADFARTLDSAMALTSAGNATGIASANASSSSAPTDPARTTSRLRTLLATLALCLALGLGLLFGWSRYHKTIAGSDAQALTNSEVRVAVLPFDNLGDTANAYFADGVADQVRGKLTSVNGLAVIARTSSVAYRGTHEPPQQVARELGVRYLLTGTVRWAKDAKGGSRVQVNPELIDVTGSGAPESKWQQSFDASITDVFKVQADIATQVANALGIALGVGARQQLAERPTTNLAAYDAYLRGESISGALATGDPPTLREALRYYQQAVTLDPTFALAWTRIAAADAFLYTNSVPTPALADSARGAAERARALAPNSPDTYAALGMYADFVLGNEDEALAQYQAGLRINPANPVLLGRLALAQQVRGQWKDALATVSRAEALDPRSARIVNGLGSTLLWLREYPQAQDALDHAIALAPTNLTALENRVMLDLARGDLTGARAVIAGASPSIDQDALIANMAEYWDLYWVLTDAQQNRLLELTPSAFDNDRGAWGLTLAGVYWLRSDTVRARAYADSASVAFEQQLKTAPQDPQRHVFLGVALAYRGQWNDAIREGQRGIALAPISRDAQGGPYYQHQMVRIYLLAGQTDKALDTLEPLLKIPYYLSPGWLRVDPTFASLRGNPRFERMTK